MIRALRILKAVARDGGMGLQELADELDLPASTVHRLAAVLESQDFLVRSAANKHFMLGPAARTLARSPTIDYLRRVANPVMERLNRETGETVFLAELVGSEVVCVSHISGTRPIRMIVNVGTKLPINAAASARILLAYLDEAQAREILERKELVGYTSRTMTTSDEVLKHLAEVKRQGYDICDDEMEPSIWAAAAPLLDTAGKATASLAVVAPLSNVQDAARRTRLVEGVVRSANEITQTMNP